MSLLKNLPASVKQSPHPAFQLPRLSDEIGRAHNLLSAKIIRSQLFKLDSESIAHYLKLAYSLGWFNRETLLELGNERTHLALYKAMFHTLEVCGENTAISDAICVPKLLDNLIDHRISPQAIKQIASASLFHGIQSPSEIMSLWKQAVDPTSAFLSKFSVAFEQSLGCSHGKKPLFHIGVSESSLGASIVLEPDLVGLPIRLPAGDDNLSVMLRDTLLLLLNNLHNVGLYPSIPQDAWHGNFYMEDDVEYFKELLSPGATPEEILNHVTVLARTVALDVDPDLQKSDLHQLIESDNILGYLGDILPGLSISIYTNQFNDNLLESLNQWASYVSVLMDDRHWIHRNHILEANVNQFDQSEITKHALNFCGESVDALSTALEKTHPQTVAAIKELFDFLLSVADDAFESRDLLNEECEGVLFGQGFLILPEFYDEEPGWNQYAKEVMLERMESDANQCGMQGIQADVGKNGESADFNDLLKLAKRYGELIAHVKNIYKAQLIENL